uniref:GSG10 salivary mucin n=1 Tax=Anopheles minimus TaxID=112268 RepID=A0A182VY72_9DIPT
MLQKRIILVPLLSVAVLTQPLLAAPIFWFLPWSFPNTFTTSSTTSSTTSGTASSGASNSSNVSVAIGNRVNTSTGLDDYGTNISNVQINVNRMRRAVSEDDLAKLDRRFTRQTTNESIISIGEHTIRLPSNISNLTVNTYLINGIPVDDTMKLPDTGVSGNTNESSTPLVTAVNIFKNFLSSFFGKQVPQG